MYNIIHNAVLALILMLISTMSFASDDITAITKVVEKYFDGTSQGKPELVRQAFADSLELQSVSKNGSLRRWLGADYIANIKQGKTNSRIGKIIAIDITDNAAIVKATVTTNKSLFTDYLLLLKLQSGWQITNKIYTAKKR